MSITNSSVLVELNISVWTANKLDRGATDAVTSSNSAARDAAQVRKNLMAGTSKRKNIADFAAGCRLWHNMRTLPWADKGARLLPTSLFLDYKAEANTRQALFSTMVDDFADMYPTLVQEAERSLGSLFDASDYPSVNEVVSKFGFRMVFSPVPESGDFRLDIPHSDMEDIRKQYESNFDARLAEAMRSPWEQLHKMLTTMSDKLTDIEGDDTKRRYHDTLITNAQDLCRMLTHLNITKDPQLEQARRQVEATMMGVTMDDIKEDATARLATKQKLDKILKAYEW